MSVQHYCQLQNKPLPLFCSSINSIPSNQLVIDLAARSFVATPPTPIVDFPIQGFLYRGSNILGVPTAVQFYFAVLGGVTPNAVIAIKSASLATTYYSAVIPTGGQNVVAMTLNLALPLTAAPLVLIITSDATSNSTVSPLSLVFTY